MREQGAEHSSQGTMKDDPNETTLFAMLNATLATAFATGMPFWTELVSSGEKH